MSFCQLRFPVRERQLQEGRYEPWGRRVHARVGGSQLGTAIFRGDRLGMVPAPGHRGKIPRWGFAQNHSLHPPLLPPFAGQSARWSAGPHRRSLQLPAGLSASPAIPVASPGMNPFSGQQLQKVLRSLKTIPGHLPGQRSFRQTWGRTWPGLKPSRPELLEWEGWWCPHGSCGPLAGSYELLPLTFHVHFVLDVSIQASQQTNLSNCNFLCRMTRRHEGSDHDSSLIEQLHRGGC